MREIRAALALVLLGCLTFLGCRGAEEPPLLRFPERPNLVLVTVDALRRDHLGVYGYERPTTPFLDRLVAAEGLAAANAWAQAPQTIYSTSSLMTSRNFPILTSGPRGMHALHDVNVTLAEVLRDAGYATLGVFTNPHHHAASGFFQGFADTLYVDPPEGRQYGRAVDVVDRFGAWLDAVPERGDAPFFAYLHFMEVHYPYQPPQKQRRLFLAPGVPGELVYATGRPEETPSPEDVAATRALYDGEIRFLDGVLEACVELLKERGLWQRTLFVLTSDHGDEFLEHGGLGHGMTLFAEQLRIPILFAGAGLERHPAPGGHLGGIVRNLDLAPTFAALAGVPAEAVASFEGASLVAALTGSPNTPSEEGERWAFARNVEYHSLTDGRWHVIVDRRDGTVQLFDVEADPGEAVDLAPERPDVVRRFSRRLAELEEEHRAAERLGRQLGADGASGEDPVDPEILRQLEALGYLGGG